MYQVLTRCWALWTEEESPPQDDNLGIAERDENGRVTSAMNEVAGGGF